MSYEEFDYGELVSSEKLNSNYAALSQDITTAAGSLQTSVNNLNNTITGLGDTVNTINSNYANKDLSNLSAAGSSAISSAATGSCTKLDLSNTNATGKANICNWIMPNYGAGESKSWNTQYTADKNGWIRVYGICGTQNRNNYWYLQIGNQTYSWRNTQGDWDIDGDTVMFPIPAGTTYKAYGGNETQYITFYPCIGG